MAIFENFLTVCNCLLITTISAIVFLIIKYYYGKRRIFKLGSKLPGPKPWPIIGNAWHFLGSKYDILAKLKRYQRKEKLLALWFGHELNVFLYGPEYAEIFCRSSKLLDRPDKVKLFDAAAPKGVLVTSGKDWKKARKITESAMPYSMVKNSISTLEMESEILIKRLREELGKPCFQLLPYVKACMIDIISDLTLELELKAQKSEIPLMEEFDLLTSIIDRRIYSILYHSDFLYKLFPDGQQYYSLLKSAKDFANKIIIDKIEKYENEKKSLKSKPDDETSQKAKRKSFWQYLVEDETLSVSDIRDHIFTLFVAGYETTSATVTLACLMLALHQNIQEKSYREILSIADGNFNDEKVQQLEYLDLIVKETLRLFPSAPTTFRKATEDVQMGEYLIPAGASVSLNLYELHRDPEQFDNPHKFNPDNFLPENIAKRHPFSYVPFVSGPRSCAGSKLAIMVIKVVLAKLLLIYKFECDYKEVEDIKFRGDIAIKLTDKGLIRILERE